MRTNTFSYGERVVTKYLFDNFKWINTLDYIHPYKSKYNSWLHGEHLDFLLFNYPIAIEVDGAQHKECVNWDGKLSPIYQKINLVNQLGRDFIKENRCNKKGINLIRIDTGYQRKRTIKKHIQEILNKKLLTLIHKYKQINKDTLISNKFKNELNTLKSPNNYNKEQLMPRSSNNFVTISKKFILNIHYHSTLIEQKILLYLIKEITPNQNNLNIDFDIEAFLTEIGDSKANINVKRVKIHLSKLLALKFEVEFINNNFKSYHWIKQCTPYTDLKNVYKIVFTNKLKPYLIKENANESFIKYDFNDICKMKSYYSIRLHEYFQLYMQESYIKYYPLNELKFYLDLCNNPTNNMNNLKQRKGYFKYKWDKYYYYSKYSDFKARVLAPAKREISKYTKYNVYFTPKKQGHKIIGIIVTKHKKM